MASSKMSSSISTLLRLPLASARRLLQDRRSLLRLFSTSHSPIPKSSPRVSTEPHMGYGRTMKEFEKVIKELASTLPPFFTCSFDINVKTCIEVFDVRIQRFDAKRFARIYGTVAVDGEDLLYNRPRTNPEFVHLGFSPLLLTGPKPSAYSIVEGSLIKIDIKDADTDGEIMQGSFIWWDRPELRQPYDRVIQQEVRGTYGHAMVSYAVFEEGVTAEIEIKLLKGGSNVYGVVAASNSLFMGQGQSVLFHREKGQGVNVGPKELVPLSKSLVALPEDSDLNVRLELWDCDGEIANTTVTFPPEHRTGERPSLRIISKQIRVTVTWTSDECF